jgi:hypothetical protein
MGRIEEVLRQVSSGHDACSVSTWVDLSLQNVFLVSDAQFIEEAIAIAEPWQSSPFLAFDSAYCSIIEYYFAPFPGKIKKRFRQCQNPTIFIHSFVVTLEIWIACAIPAITHFLARICLTSHCLIHRAHQIG